MRRLWVLGLLILTIGFAAFAGKVTFNIAGGWPFPYHGNPYLTGGVGVAYWLSFEPFAYYVPGSGQWIPRLAERWEVVGNVVKVYLRKDVRWSVEALVPDFRGKRQSLNILLDSFPPDVLCINVEVVRRLYPKVRPAGNYEWVLDLLAYAKEKNPKLITKSSLIVGLGETDEEVWETLRDLALCRVDIVTVGLYLMPSRECVRPARIVFEDTFKAYEKWGRKLGIPVIVSGPLVRSSFRAEEAYMAAVGVMEGEKGGCNKPQGQKGL